ncbi:MAG: membrane or secreted protein [Chlorobi bacterium]|nr:membrane or secreted protein [Chlorobiota bacterium]
MVFLKILLIAIVIMAFAFAGFAVKMFFKKDGEFKKQCSSVNPKTGQPFGCVCGGESEEKCKNKEKVNELKIKIQELKTG